MQKRFKVSLASVVCGVAAALSLASCQMATPQTRIETNPLLYQALPAEHQTMVAQGRICEGMSPDAVFLAWGRPTSAPFEGQKDGKHIVRWSYDAEEAVFVDGCMAPYGWYGPGHGCWGAAYMGGGVAYVPRNVATVVFENGKVVSWECRGAR